MKMRQIVSESKLDIRDLLKIRSMFGEFVDLHNNFVYKFEDKGDEKLVPVLRAFAKLEDEMRNYVKLKGIAPLKIN